MFPKISNYEYIALMSRGVFSTVFERGNVHLPYRTRFRSVYAFIEKRFDNGRHYTIFIAIEIYVFFSNKS